jgi:hypothetical protein
MTGSNLLRRLVKLVGNSTEHCVKFLSLQICDDFVKPLHCQFTSLLATLSLPNPLGDLTATASVQRHLPNLALPQSPSLPVSHRVGSQNVKSPNNAFALRQCEICSKNFPIGAWGKTQVKRRR